MNKSRLEAFSDGVFAIVITLLILDIRLPDVAGAQLGPALVALLPRIGVYVMSFLLIGLYWVFHHHGMQRIERTDSAFVWLNILYLLFVSFIPFPTALLGRYHGEQLAVVLYGVNLMLANGMGFAMTFYAHRTRELLHPDHQDRGFNQDWPVYAVVNTGYVIAIACSFLSPLISLGIYAAVVVGIGLRTVRERL